VSNVKCPGNPTSPLRPVITNARLRRLNWLLNSYYNPQLALPTTCGLAEPVSAGQYWSGSPATPVGNYGPITKDEMQAAIWVLTGAYLLTEQTWLVCCQHAMRGDVMHAQGGCTVSPF
jgi:hypothetical protein